MPQCPRCNSRNIELIWCETCESTGVDATTGDDCPDCDMDTWICNSCGKLFELGDTLRYLTGHRVNPCNDMLTIAVLDEPGQGGACHNYTIVVPGGDAVPIDFQNGPIKEVGVNGVTHEALLEILIDRLTHFQAGDYACEENGIALTHLKAAQEALLSRTKKRMNRGVEGTHAV